MVYGLHKYYSFGMSLLSNAQCGQKVSEAGSASILREINLPRCTAYSCAQSLPIFHTQFGLSMNAIFMVMETFKGSYYKCTGTTTATTGFTLS
jgi:hypothetical protein